MMIELKKCNDSRNCFAREDGCCKILTATYPDRSCPFCKPKITDKAEQRPRRFTREEAFAY